MFIGRCPPPWRGTFRCCGKIQTLSSRGSRRLRRSTSRGTHPVPRATLKCCGRGDRKSTRLNSSHTVISYAVFCLKKKKKKQKKRDKQKKDILQNTQVII